MSFDPLWAITALAAYGVGFGMGRFWVKESVRELRAERTELRVANVVMRERLVMEIMLSPGDPEENALRAQKAVEAAQRLAGEAKTHVYPTPSEPFLKIDQEWVRDAVERMGVDPDDVESIEVNFGPDELHINVTTKGPNADGRRQTTPEGSRSAGDIQRH